MRKYYSSCKKTAKGLNIAVQLLPINERQVEAPIKPGHTMALMDQNGNLQWLGRDAALLSWDHDSLPQKQSQISNCFLPPATLSHARVKVITIFSRLVNAWGFCGLCLSEVCEHRFVIQLTRAQGLHQELLEAKSSLGKARAWRVSLHPFS